VTLLGILPYKCGMLSFLLFLGSERCKFEKMVRRQCSEDNIVHMLDEWVWRSSVPPVTSVEINHHHHNKHQGLGHLARSVSTVTAALANVSLVSRLFSFLVDYSGMFWKGFSCVAFFAGVKASSFSIHLSCLVCIQSVVRGVWSHLFYGH